MTDIEGTADLPLDPPQPATTKSEKRQRQRSQPAQAVESRRDTQDPVVVSVLMKKNSAAVAETAVDLFDGLRRPLTAAFISTLIFGIGAEWLGSVYAAAGGMVAYFLFGILSPGNARNTERFADSLYYLGFVLTLWALCLAMLPGFRPPDISSQDIIDKFGIAIVTTFLGMSLRIILIQLRQTVTDQEEEARTSIAKYISRLEGEMQSAVNELRKFREQSNEEMRRSVEKMRETHALVSERLENVTKQSGDAVEASNALIVEHTRAAMVKIEESASDLAGRLREVVLPSDLGGLREATLVRQPPD